MTQTLTPGTVRELWVSLTDAKAPLPQLTEVDLAVVTAGRIPGSADWTAPTGSDTTQAGRLRVALLWTAPADLGQYALWVRVRGNPEVDELLVETLTVAAPPAPVDYDTPTGVVRLLIADTAAPFVLQDPAVRAFLRMEGVSATDAAAADPDGEHLRGCRLAAANALDSIASSTVQLAQVIRTQDLNVDGAKAAGQLQAQARALRALVARDDLDLAAAHSGVREFGDY